MLGVDPPPDPLKFAGASADANSVPPVNVISSIFVVLLFVTDYAVTAKLNLRFLSLIHTASFVC